MRSKDKPSRTAYKVALLILTLGAKPDMESILPPGIVKATKNLLIASGTAWPLTIRWSESSRAVSVYEAFDWLLPGQFEAFAHRKAFFERQVRERMSAGARQVLVLGAGYDTLCLRLAPKFPTVKFFEIDHPATARFKAKGVAVMGKPENLFLIAKDLGQCKLVDVLDNHDSWKRKSNTIILAEGLLMYLYPETVLNLFSQCADLVGEGSRFAFSYIPAGSNGRPYVGRWTGLMRWLQKAIGEPWVWSICPKELASFLEGAGWENAPESLKESCVHGVEVYAVAAKR